MSNDIQEQLGRVRAFAGKKADIAADRLKEGSSLARERIDAAREHAAGAYSKSRKTAGESLSTARDATYKIADTANRFVIEHPLAATAAAVAAGALISMFFPKGRAALKAAPGFAGTIGSKAIAAAKSARDAVEHSDIAETVKARAGEAAAAARSRAADAASTARSIIAEADIPGTVKTRATEAAEAAREAIERARLPERASKLAESAAAKAGDALIAAGKAVNERLPHR